MLLPLIQSISIIHIYVEGVTQKGSLLPAFIIQNIANNHYNNNNNNNNDISS